MKTHLNLATTDLGKSVAFYSVLLGSRPAKVFDDYALFITDDPALELALDLREGVRADSDAHYGVCVDSAAQVDVAIERLQQAGLVASVEREEACCYATQTKVWAIDPDGRRWEVYTVHEDVEAHSAAVEGTCCTA